MTTAALVGRDRGILILRQIHDPLTVIEERTAMSTKNTKNPENPTARTDTDLSLQGVEAAARGKSNTMENELILVFVLVRYNLL